MTANQTLIINTKTNAATHNLLDTQRDTKSRVIISFYLL